MKKIRLDTTKLLGVRVVRGPLVAKAGAKVGSKRGVKVGVKSGAKVGAKIGLKRQR